MLDHLRERVVRSLAQATRAMLISDGPGGLQADAWTCMAQGLRLYLLVSAASDHLVNLELRPDVIVATERWRLEGRAERLTRDDAPDLALWRRPEAPWSALICVRPTRLHVLQPTGWGDCETLVIDE